MRTSLIVVAVLSLCLMGTAAQAAPAMMSFGTSGGAGWSLDAAGTLTFDNLFVTTSSNGGDIVGYNVALTSLLVDTASREVDTVVTGAGTFEIVTYGFTRGSSNFSVYDPTGVTELLDGTFLADSLVIVNGTGVTIDSDSDLDDITGLTLLNSPTEQTLLDFAGIGQAAMTASLSVASPTNFDTLLQTGGAASGALEGSAEVVPEPATLALLGLGLGGLFVGRRRRG